LSKTNIENLFETYIKTKNGKITLKNNIINVTYPNKQEPEKYTYSPFIGREQKIPLISPGSPAFQQILRECQKNGITCQIRLNPKENIETNIKQYFKDTKTVCIDCDKITIEQKTINICTKQKNCYHQINNGKIVQIKTGKQEAIRYFQFHYTVTFHNKLRPKNEEIITIWLDENANVSETHFDNCNSITDKNILFSEDKSKVKPGLFDQLKETADKLLQNLICEKVALFNLPLNREKNFRLRAFEKRLKQERREQILSHKRDFDPLKWQNNYQTLLKKEEESYLTNISIKLVNFLVINTYKIKFDLILNNNALIHSTLTLGLNQPIEVTCPICKKKFAEGYATQDSLYVCKNCIKQSIDSNKIYSKKVNLSLDNLLNEYIEQDTGFICTVCRKRYSHLLEFKCSHDNSSICIQHYDFCDICGNEKTYSKDNLTYTNEFKHQLCPKHTKKIQI
jgi:outer membrane protein OmpA-like peptidoglycan-associated protein